MSLYIHIPFCGTKCTYCAFNTYTNLDHLIPPFITALAREITIIGSNSPNKLLHTVYFGGGTPSLLGVQQLANLLETTSRNFAITAKAEISMEANPSDLSREYLSAVRQLGVNRLSIGMQSANANELALFARTHDQASVDRSIENARASGFTNINLDLIYGIPQQSVGDWQRSLERLLVLKPEHVSLYALGLEDGTPLKIWVDGGKYPRPDDDVAADMYDLATVMLEDSGYLQYEISNWAKPGYECQHNLQYWRNLPYPGVGPGAHGYAGGIRYSTILLPQQYIRAFEADGGEFEFPYSPATHQFSIVDRDTEIAETLIMGLRLTQEGIPRQTFLDRFGIDVIELHQSLIDRFVEGDLLFVDSAVVRLTKKGRLLSNLIFRELV